MMSDQLFVLGMDAKIYEGPVGAGLGSLTEMDNVRDVTLTMEAGEADVSTRGSGGWEATAPTRKKCDVEFEMLWKPGDECFEEIKDAFLNNGQVRLAVLTGDRSEGNSEGPMAEFSITSFTRNESQTEGVTVSVTAKIAQFVEWVGGD
ncbi:MAG: phage tail tube protein [Opitutaceae bacterium]|jgi:hypothetical protein